jgi:hypothetical protein
VSLTLSTSGGFANDATTTLELLVTTGAATVTLMSGAGALFPSPSGGSFFPLTMRSASNSSIYEIAYCTSRSGDVLTVTRAQEGTSATAFNEGDIASLLPTAGTNLFTAGACSSVVPPSALAGGVLTVFSSTQTFHAGQSGGANISTTASFTPLYNGVAYMSGNAAQDSGAFNNSGGIVITSTGLTAIFAPTNWTGGASTNLGAFTALFAATAGVPASITVTIAGTGNTISNVGFAGVILAT